MTPSCLLFLTLGVLASLAKAMQKRACPFTTVGMAAMVLLCLLASGCSVGPGTPAGTYLITITGTSGNLTRSTMVTLIVR